MKTKKMFKVGIGLAGAIGLSTILKDKKKREQLFNYYQNSKNKWVAVLNSNSTTSQRDLVEKAGNPNPYDTQDNKMVDEGALYGVKYYNKTKQTS